MFTGRCDSALPRSWPSLPESLASSLQEPLFFAHGSHCFHFWQAEREAGRVIDPVFRGTMAGRCKDDLLGMTRLLQHSLKARPIYLISALAWIPDLESGASCRVDRQAGSGNGALGPVTRRLPGAPSEPTWGPPLIRPELSEARDPVRQPLEGRARTLKPSPHCCVAANLYRFNIRRRLSKIPMSCQISFTTFSVAPSTSRSAPANEAQTTTISAMLRQLYGI